MSSNCAQTDAARLNNATTFNADSHDTISPTTGISRNCTCQDLVRNSPESTEKHLTKYHGPSINSNVPFLEQQTRNNQTHEVNLEMRSPNQSERSSFIKCIESTTNHTKFHVRKSSWHSICGPSPNKIIRWLFIFVLTWVTFTIVINMQKKLTSLDEELKFATGEMHTVQNNYAKLRKEFLDEQRHVDNKLRELSSPSSSYGSGHDVIDEISDNIGNSNLSRLSPDENEKDEPSNLVSSLGADSPTVTSDIVVTNSNTSNTGYELLKRGHECNSVDEYLGGVTSVVECAKLCRNNEGCKYFSVGNDGGEENCYWEKTELPTCPEGWDTDTYDFYKLKYIDSKACITKNNKECIFPFYYKDQKITSCRQTWKDVNPWCATRVDENGKYIDESTAWDWCSESCTKPK